jgi:Zn-dependent protease
MEFIYLLPGAFFAPVIHEWVKAFTSHTLGDPTPRNRGFLTANPFKYFEPLGFIMMMFFRGFGWGQPVPTAALHYKNRRLGVLITYILPSVVNLVLGIITVMVLSLLVNNPVELFWLARIMHINEWVADARWITSMVLFAFAQCNVLLALFNLIPIHPLDASKILQLFVRPETLVKLNHYEKPMQIVLILALVLGLVGFVFNPVWEFILRAAWLA